MLITILFMSIVVLYFVLAIILVTRGEQEWFRRVSIFYGFAMMTHAIFFSTIWMFTVPVWLLYIAYYLLRSYRRS